MMLRLVEIEKRFGATAALRQVTLEVGAGEVHALIGENGAGKSTLMKVLSGAHAPDRGRMELAGQPYAPLTPLAARRCGVAMIYQELNLALHLSAEANILLGSEPARGGWLDRRAGRRAARELLAQLGHPDFPLGRLAGACTVAEQQMLEIARALLGQPKVLIMDEPTSSLAPDDAQRLFALVRRLRAQGVSVVYISHFLEECLGLADRYTVLKDGAATGTGAMADVTADRLIALMTGRPAEDLYPGRASRCGGSVLDVRGVRSRGRLRRASLTLRAGEITGLAGLMGAGRTELLRACFGLDELTAGEVVVVGAAAGRASPRQRWRQGVGFLSEDRKGEGLMLGRSIADNLTLPKLGALGRAGWIDGARQRTVTEQWMATLRIKGRDGLQPVGELSGGNQQKVALGRLLAHPANILLLDEPTRGIDVGSKTQFYRLLADLADAGRAILLTSSYLPELLGLCDTIGVFCRGELAAVRPRAEWSEAELMRVATGTA